MTKIYPIYEQSRYNDIESAYYYFYKLTLEFKDYNNIAYWNSQTANKFEKLKSKLENHPLLLENQLQFCELSILPSGGGRGQKYVVVAIIKKVEIKGKAERNRRRKTTITKHKPPTKTAERPPTTNPPPSPPALGQRYYQ